MQKASAPRILVTADSDSDFDGVRLRRDYIRRLRQAGGLPLLLPHTEQPLSAGDAAAYLADCHGLLLTGGGDIEPWRYGRAPGPDLGLDPARDQAELVLFQAAWQRKMPIFGVCRGAQLINVALGGDIYQDLDADRGEGENRGNALHQHGSEERYGLHHPVEVTASQLSRLIGQRPTVNSHHHQGLRRIAPELTAAAFAPDGLCEAVLGRDRPLLAVQWHPECMENMQPLFNAFVELCRSFAAGDM